MTSDDHDQLRINTLRAICVDAVQAANSGHCGSPIRMATTDYVLRQRLIRFDPDRIIRGNDDRFVPSAGNCSTLLQALLVAPSLEPATNGPVFHALRNRR